MAHGRADAAHDYIMQCAEMNNRKASVTAITPNVYLTVVFTLDSRQPNSDKKHKLGNKMNCLTGFVCFYSHFSQMLLESTETESGDRKYTFVDLFRTPYIRKLAICSGLVG